MTLPQTSALVTEIRALLQAARATAYREVNALLVRTNFEIGRRIVMHEQRGEVRAGYGKAVLEQLSAHLTGEFGRGFSVENLTLMRRFYVAYRGREANSQSLIAILELDRTPHDPGPILQTQSTISETASPMVPHRGPQAPAFTLSWTHYAFLTGIADDAERSFYEIEATRSGWSVREMRRQFDTSLYERLALSRDPQGIAALAAQGHAVERAADLLKEPYVLEFLGLEARPSYSESELESSLIDKLEQFLLELGKGFLFEGRQRRFSFDDEHFYVDLVFYNRLLRCFVLIDLKIGKLTHQDLGQMQMYVNYYDSKVKLPDEHPTVGIILCKKKHDALVEITLPKDANVHAREYRLVLPSKADLRRKLLEWTGEALP